MHTSPEKMRLWVFADASQLLRQHVSMPSVSNPVKFFFKQSSCFNEQSFAKQSPCFNEEFPLQAVVMFQRAILRQAVARFQRAVFRQTVVTFNKQTPSLL
ncbi:unnamed protein product [Heligmosomoides polygyrus]|uniref:C2 domain-containing protein n=1 Tax=Heligmosomoides polygyrus TaxID=6339 RepID=A0A3P8BSA5_HELPZ|nr:unnamed protein product [Heligmosomoides polygyrus]